MQWRGKHEFRDNAGKWTNTNWSWIDWGLQGLWSLMGRLWQKGIYLWGRLCYVVAVAAGSWGWCPCRFLVVVSCWLASEAQWGLVQWQMLFTSWGFPRSVCPSLLEYLCALTFLTSVLRLWLAFPFVWQESGKTQLECVNVVALQGRWDPAWASQFHNFCGPAKTILGSCQGDLMEHRDLTHHVSALLVCSVNCQPPFVWRLTASHTASSPANWKLHFRHFAHFFQTNMVFSPLSLCTIYPFPPPIFSFFFLFSPRC